MRRWKTYHLENKSELRIQLLNYASRFETFSFLDSCENAVYGKTNFDFLLAAESRNALQCPAGKAFSQLQSFVDETKDWCFGILGYDLKNEIEELSSKNFDGIQLPDLYFFIPEVLIIVERDEIKIGSFQRSDEIFQEIKICNTSLQDEPSNPFVLQQRISKHEYIDILGKLRNHIIDGDIYEVNFCQEFFAEGVAINVAKMFDHLCTEAKAPFSALMKMDNKYLISASPERFLKKQGNKIVSQPMKGTMRRSEDAAEDEKLKEQLFLSEKDKAENVMIVDLVRNDLAKCAEPGTISVDELFGIYTFEYVHQMVSTVSAELKKGIHSVEAIKNAFPMGSMTGAPKVMAMQLIEEYEKTKRGLFSGAVGYFDEEMNFDFNVVIRSMLYNSQKKYLSIQVGSAIVYDSDPEEEYEECLVKLKGLLNAMTSVKDT